MRMTKGKRLALIEDIASREYTAKELEDKHGLDRDDLLDFRDTHIEEITKARERLDSDDIPDPPTIADYFAELANVELSQLWVTRKSQRILRYQFVIDHMLTIPQSQWDSTIIREIRSYIANVAEELGQIPNRGSATDGEDTKATYTITGVHPDELR